MSVCDSAPNHNNLRRIGSLPNSRTRRPEDRSGGCTPGVLKRIEVRVGCRAKDLDRLTADDRIGGRVKRFYSWLSVPGGISGMIVDNDSSGHHVSLTIR